MPTFVRRPRLALPALAGALAAALLAGPMHWARGGSSAPGSSAG
ncbi:MAG: hypothetical protein ACTHQ3_05730 [Motilibacteraceae bacterium]